MQFAALMTFAVIFFPDYLGGGVGSDF